MAMTTKGSATVFADDASDDAAGNDYTIAYVPTTMNNPFWTAMLGGIKEEMEAKGMDVDSQLVTVDASSANTVALPIVVIAIASTIANARFLFFISILLLFLRFCSFILSSDYNFSKRCSWTPDSISRFPYFVIIR